MKPENLQRELNNLGVNFLFCKLRVGVDPSVAPCLIPLRAFDLQRELDVSPCVVLYKHHFFSGGAHSLIYPKSNSAIMSALNSEPSKA